MSRKHGGTSKLDNLAFCCVVSNRLKGSDVASIDWKTEAVVGLFHPRRERWDDYFRLKGPLIEPLTVAGAATVRLLRLNATERVAERRVLSALGRYP